MDAQGETTPEVIRERFRLLSALDAVGHLRPYEAVAAADRTLMDGYYHDYLLAIIDAGVDEHDVVFRKLREFCSAITLPTGDREWAVDYLINSSLRRMTQPDSDPDVEFLELLDVVGRSTLRGKLGGQCQPAIDRLEFLEMIYNYNFQLRDVPREELDRASVACQKTAQEMRRISQSILCMMARSDDPD